MSKTKLKAHEILKLDPQSEEAKKLEAELQNSFVVEKSLLRPTNQAFFLGLFFLILGIITLHHYPNAKLSEGFGGISVYGLFFGSGITLMSWFKTGEILKAVGDFISKARGGH
ncbi:MULTISPECIES: hypothetical protein [Leptospira]|uniref:hypothetical protein n=1 Tax=Leptospira TaxID=171 RepID=UPI001090D1AB|nr:MULTISPECIES: hypothetical protein [Leptospira]MCG6195604.1 hypothetical protein [Leptospira sanjuanensis]TGM99688.1 hypothetical protein EHR10_08840 [Leptospira yasudae]